MQEYFILYFEERYVLAFYQNHLTGDSNKYPKHIFYEEIRVKQGLPYILFCPLRILCNSKFILMETSLETNAAILMRVHCNINMIHLIDDYLSVCCHYGQGGYSIIIILLL